MLRCRNAGVAQGCQESSTSPSAAARRGVPGPEWFPPCVRALTNPRPRAGGPAECADADRETGRVSSPAHAFRPSRAEGGTAMDQGERPVTKLLLFSDLHADAAAARRLVERAAGVDVLVGAGDFGTVRRQVRVCIDVLRQVEKPVVIVAGNNESTEELADACRGWAGAHILHGSGVTLGGVAFFGIGGGIPVTPFGAWSYDFTEDQADALLAPCPAECILVSHSPPLGAVDRSP